MVNPVYGQKSPVLGAEESNTLVEQMAGMLKMLGSVPDLAGSVRDTGPYISGAPAQPAVQPPPQAQIANSGKSDKGGVKFSSDDKVKIADAKKAWRELGGAIGDNGAMEDSGLALSDFRKMSQDKLDELNSAFSTYNNGDKSSKAKDDLLTRAEELINGEDA